MTARARVRHGPFLVNGILMPEAPCLETISKGRCHPERSIAESRDLARSALLDLQGKIFFVSRFARVSAPPACAYVLYTTID